MVVSGSGNVAIHAVQKAQELGAVVVAVSDSDGYVVHEGGLDLGVLKDVKAHRAGAARRVRPSHGCPARLGRVGLGRARDGGAAVCHAE
ncbi:hypothetical protein GCM10025876_14800 [Demequina litorisediminis]|uniref:Glutamate/phenylalanine/leucine/valine/L-tryptophan dehydrogenase C-terminal domain-containing protein n=1 Tax=Demequina litorisediminis TaxID=1849022 RepID=A0ABQ6IC42_9MICO|nr:hypothetical protein GCM10025876_14800 [Demequina litorisediminis]